MGLKSLFLVATLAGPLLAQEKPNSEPSRMEILLEQKLPSGIRATDPGHVFQSGDLVRFRFKTSFEGFLYVMDHGTSGKYTLLFPKDDTGRENKIQRGKEYLLPATNRGWFEIGGPPGHEIVYWAVSPTALTGSPALRTPPIPPSLPPNTDQLPPGTTPRCDDAIFRARGDCVDTSAGAKPVAKGEPVPDDVARFSGHPESGLLFLRSQNTSTVSSPGPLVGPVIYEFHLAHR